MSMREVALLMVSSFEDFVLRLKIARLPKSLSNPEDQSDTISLLYDYLTLPTNYRSHNESPRSTARSNRSTQSSLYSSTKGSEP